MASTSKSEEDEAQEEEEEELERFDDFTLASSWERFISEIEAVCRQWLADGPKNLLEKGAAQLEFYRNLYMVKFEFKYAMKTYSMEYYFETNSNGKQAGWNLSLHDLQLCFGVKEFLVIAPKSASGVVLDAPEASKLLSAVAIALSNCSSLWPAFVPVHNPSRRAYIGIQNMGTVFTRRFEADCIHSPVSIKLMHLDGLYELFVSKFVYFTLDLAMHHFEIHFTMKSTYRTMISDDDDDGDLQSLKTENDGGNPGTDIHKSSSWDDDCPWNKWYSADDPVKGLELIATWSEMIVKSSLEMAELENVSPHEAEKWMVLPNLSPNLDSPEGHSVGFASQLHFLLNALDKSFGAQFMEDYVSVENPGFDYLKSSMIVPPPTVLDRVFKDLFHGGSQLQDVTKGEHKNSRAIKGAPVESLFAQFCLHALWVGNCNIRAIAVLWIEFVREIRWCWEESQPLSKMIANSSIDLSTCLIYQKLQMLSLCIEKKCELNEDFQDCIESDDQTYGHNEMQENGLEGDKTTKTEIVRQEFDGFHDSPLTHNVLLESQTMASRSNMKPANVVSTAPKSWDSIRRGSAGVVGSMMLLKSHQSLHAPVTQDAPPMTEDMHEERLQAVETFSDSYDFSARLEREILLSDMSAFKAANPDSVFEDFIRWHSPGDWVNDDAEESGSSRTSTVKELKDDWPPRGRLSQRMSEHGNLWRKVWNEAPALPAYDQKPLLDPNREGEKILHYLETLRPHQLLEQMVCTAFRASADTLNQTNFGGLKQMKTKMEQLYLTMASALRPLQRNHICSNSESIEDVRRLCVVFEHVEKLLALAASLYCKFKRTPRLCEAIFCDYYNFYLPRMETGTADTNEREFNTKQQVEMQEREVVSNLFKPPPANKSRRKVLSMGNLLNGHEPVTREIIFSMRDGLKNSHYAANTPTGFEQEIETYRMYISGSSNDVHVALSVTSCD